MKCVATALTIALTFSLASAKPRIKFDTTTVNCGVAIEGKTESIKAVFALKNTGDQVLKIESVRPGCGCTVVKFDSLVQPGKTSKIESSVNIKGLRSGPISKSITVISNAENQPTAHLTIQATIEAIVDVSDSYLDLTSGTLPRTVYLSSRKSDLKVTDVVFRVSGAGAATPAWQAELPIPVQFRWQGGDSTRADGYKVYKMDILKATTGEPKYGEFIVHTNHPDKKEITIRGRIGA